MWTQRDQIQAYQFLRRRLVSALVSADANHPVSPGRRLVLGTIIGIAVALLITAVFGVIGLLKPSGGKDWLAGGKVIVEEETGARFILGEEGTLHPVLNYASARLLAGGDGSATVKVPAKNLAKAGRGPRVGIPGAPDSLPGKERLQTGPWISCSRTSRDQPTDAEPATSVLLGASSTGRPLAAGEGLLVRLPGGERYLISSGHRFRLSPEAGAALGYDRRVPIVVSSRWLNTVPAGRDLDFVEVDGAGRKGPRVGVRDTEIGQVLSVAGTSTPGYYLVRAEGLVPITQTEAALIMQAPANAAAQVSSGGGQTIEVSAADVAAAGLATDAGTAGGADPAGYPDRIPVAVEVNGETVAVCAEGDGSGSAKVTIGASAPLPAGARPQPVAAGDGRTADEVYVPPSGGAVVAEQPSGTVYVLTDLGTKYPVASGEALAALGYGAVPKLPVSAGLLALVPSGPALDPAAAAGFG
ncbi:type VII secretion protein EccB [Amycolatopsis sp. YIM 10]|uniref:type VII secretion protein EccB n=1 Tax=Amycolatopsis sp. YIM 10 TaxID=2653857 RepID=UPI00129068B1|nr:type VII secretion protein EccB [Amycolatopsis sp. YIM 10]QFU87701.1 ESX-1 secretion system protein eccB1 [Amycolatopsis sp. YIM 10]